jgi:hypothetical protein
MGRAENSSTRSRYAVAIPRKVVKPSGTPNSLITICPPAFLHALRVRRSSHKRRVCARCARDKITSAGAGEASEGGGSLTSTRWCRTSCIQARRCSQRLQSRHSTGAGPTTRGCRSTLTWRGFFVVLGVSASRPENCTPRFGCADLRIIVSRY